MQSSSVVTNMTEMTLKKEIEYILRYGLESQLIEQEDVVVTRNSLLYMLGLSEPLEDVSCLEENMELENILAELCDAAYDAGLIEENTTTYRDLFDTRVMSALVKRTSEIIRDFSNLENEDGIEAATDWFYRYSQDTDYIRRYRIVKDIKWEYKTPYGVLNMTINLSKPEKDPKAIAAAGKTVSNSYPKCLLCAENEGYGGRINHPARMNLRTIPVQLCEEEWRMQYSPYVYYNEHCIVFNKQHVPMKITKLTFGRLLEFVERFPHYCIGSNADLPIVGGSILSHDHFQGGRFEFAMANAATLYDFEMKQYPEVIAKTLYWPLSVIRLQSRNRQELAMACNDCLDKWRAHSDEQCRIYAQTEGEPHNTITPIARRRGDLYEMDLVLRNNLTTAEHPMGLFHPHEEYHHIKKENIGLIEVMGLAVLPSRLESEMSMLKEALLQQLNLTNIPQLKKHAAWAQTVIQKHPEFCEENARDILLQEIGEVFQHVLEDAGVYKNTSNGEQGFRRFTDLF